MLSLFDQLYGIAERRHLKPKILLKLFSLENISSQVKKIIYFLCFPICPSMLILGGFFFSFLFFIFVWRVFPGGLGEAYLEILSPAAGLKIQFLGLGVNRATPITSDDT